MKLQKLCMSMLVLAGAYGVAQADDNDARFVWEADFTMEFHNYGGNFNAGITMMPLPWIGVSGELGAATDCAGVSNFLKVGSTMWIPDKVDYEPELSYSEVSFVMRYAAVLQTPAIWTSHTGDSRLTLRVEPGVLLAFPANKGIMIEGARYVNGGGRYTFWHARAGLALQLYRVGVSAGYAVTDYDLYSCYRNIRVNGHRYFGSAPKVVHGIYLSVGYKF